MSSLAHLPLAIQWDQAMFALGVILLTGLLVRHTYRRLGKRRKGTSNKYLEEQPRPEGPWSGAHQDAHARLNRQEVELHQLARDFAGQLDSKMLVLQELITQSQKQIDRLEELLDQAEKQKKN